MNTISRAQPYFSAQRSTPYTMGQQGNNRANADCYGRKQAESSLPVEILKKLLARIIKVWKGE